MSGVFVDFNECKAMISLPDVLDVFDIAEQFHERNGTWRGVCPFPSHIHNPVRPNPSGFTFGLHEGIWKWRCWGDCKAVGTVVTFVERYLQIEPAHVRLWFHEHFANRLTAQAADAKRGGESRPRDGTPECKEARPVVATPERAVQKTARPEKRPEETADYKPIRFKLNLDPDVPYLTEQRGLTAETIERFGIGLCGRGMLRGYVAIPVWEYPRGRFPYGYIGRWPGDDYDEDRPRYKCPPGFPTPRLVYGLQEALETPDDWPLIVVEGCFKVFYLYQHGFPNAVATLGSSLSDEQARLLGETGRPIVLMFDGDEAGRAGMVDAAPKLALRTFVRTIDVGDGRQPEDLSTDELQDILRPCARVIVPQ